MPALMAVASASVLLSTALYHISQSFAVPVDFTFQSLSFKESARQSFFLVVLQPAVNAMHEEGEFRVPFGPKESPLTLGMVAVATFAAIYGGAVREMAVLLVLPLWADTASAMVDGRPLGSARQATVAVATAAALLPIIAH